MQDEQSNMLSLQKINYLKNHEKKAYTYTNIINKEVLSKIKYILIICFIIIFRTHVELIEINNEIILYEKNIDFSNLKTDIKAIALYLPQFHLIKENNEWWGMGFTEWYNVRKSSPLYNGHHQPRIPGDSIKYLGYYDLSDVETIKKQVNLAKEHGIYGFGIYYYWFSGKRLLEKPLDIFIKNKEIKFNFFLIWANEDWTRRWNGYEGKILIKQMYKEYDSYNFIKDIKKYIIDERYIKIDNKPIIGIYEPKKILSLSTTILNWRKESKKIGLGEIYILVCLNNYGLNEMKELKLFDAVYEFSPRDSLKYSTKYFPYLLYMMTLYKNLDYVNITNDFPLYRGCMVEFDNSPRKKRDPAIYENYSPEQFFMINKKIIEWTRKNYNEKNRFIFINAWNEWGEGTYLEPDRKYGYASINSLSKALFNKSSIKINTDLFYSNIRSSSIAIQVHLYYDHLINEIINKTNNIPIKFDLFISLNSLNKKNYLYNLIKKNSKANQFEIEILENKGKYFMPFLIQMKNKIKKYKYICHIHTKKSLYLNVEENWRKYLLNNLLGNKDIISEILTDFKNNDKLGFVFPENYYKIIFQFEDKLNRLNILRINYVMKKYFGKFINLRISKKLELPLGNMFWAKVDSIFQIFEKEFQNDIKNEIEQKQKKNAIFIMERLLLVIVKLNGYYYKKIFKHF